MKNDLRPATGVGGFMMRLRNKDAGFTLVETLIVVVVIAALAAIAIPQYNGYRIRMYNSIAISDLRAFRVCMEANRSESGAYPVIP